MAQASRLRYLTPASDWNAALPLGSGKLGMMVYGGTRREELQLNEESLWSGFPADWDNPDCLAVLPRMRGLLFERRLREAEALCRKYLVCRGKGSDDPYYGSFQTAGSLFIESEDPLDTDGYERGLDLYRGAAYTRFGNVSRTHTVSHRHQLTASRVTGQRDCRLYFERAGCGIAYYDADAYGDANCGEILVTGAQAGPGALRFCTVIQLETDGRVRADGDGLYISDAGYFDILTCTATSYRTQQEPESICRERLTQARALGFEQILADEEAWMAEAMGRCELELDEDETLAALPTDERLERLRAGEHDPGLCRLYFDYGRYLLTGSGWGELPANLQGVWCTDLHAPWTGDYHININLQMNYWFADAAGLSDCADSFYRYVAFLAEHGRHTAQVMYGCRGWVAHTLANPWGFTAPGQDPDWGAFLCGGAWCCCELYDHYRYTCDLAFLRQYWPVIRGAAEFFCDFLVQDPRTGYMVTAPSNSPENSYICPGTAQRIGVTLGPTMDSMIVRELFTDVLEGAEMLGEHDELTRRIADLLPQLPPTRVNSYGGIQEWIEDYGEWEPGHRHISQLYGLYPGTQISPDATPELAVAARNTLERRLTHGGGHTGWSRAWIINFFARLRDGAEAEKHLHALLVQSTLPNLFDNHPPFQIDGNFGGAAGIIEMLVQSHEHCIRLLPALPPSWASHGALRNVRVRGGFIVSFEWKDGRVVAGSIYSPKDAETRIYYNGSARRLRLTPGMTRLPVGE